MMRYRRAGVEPGVRRVFRHCLWILLGFFTAPLVAAASGAESLFLSAYGIYQCNLDGSELRLLRRLYPHTFFRELAANSRTGTLYWIEETTNAGIFIYRHEPSGGNAIIFQTESQIVSLTVDEVGEKLYYAYAVTNGDEIRRCDLDGANPQTVLSSRGARVYGLDVVPHSPVQANLYWSESNIDTHEGRIGRADVFYGIGMNPAIIVHDLDFPKDISVDPNGEKIYWVDPARNLMQRANWDGSSVETLLDSILPSSLTLDLSRKKIYWVNHESQSIERVDFDGSNRETVLMVFAAGRIDIGPDGPVGIDRRGWGQMKRIYR